MDDLRVFNVFELVVVFAFITSTVPLSVVVSRFFLSSFTDTRFCFSTDYSADYFMSNSSVMELLLRSMPAHSVVLDRQLVSVACSDDVSDGFEVVFVAVSCPRIEFVC